MKLYQLTVHRTAEEEEEEEKEVTIPSVDHIEHFQGICRPLARTNAAPNISK